MTKTFFHQMELTPAMEKAIQRMGFEAATPIQAQAIPVIRTGADVIARSRTGTGKTVAFAIPALERVDTSEKAGIQVLVLCPTRELAMQATEEIQRLARFQEGIRPVAIYGGARIDKQCIALRRANVVVGTPGRVMDHMRRKSLKLADLKMVVLDEADEMLNMGFKEDIETILSETPEQRQTVLFSATMPPAILKITHQFQKQPQMIQADDQQHHEESRIQQRYIAVPHSQKKAALSLLLRYYDPSRAIVFCGTKKMADELCQDLEEQGISAQSLHSDIKQDQRTAVMRSFKSGKTTVLVATDIAARGIDVNDVECVFNYDLPQNKEHYIHRIGRTGRAGKSGVSVTICTSRREAAELEYMSGRQAQEMPIPSTQDIQERSAAQMACAVESVLDGAVAEVFGLVVKELRQKGYSPEQIAQAALAVHYGSQMQPVEQVCSLAEKAARKGSGAYRAIQLDIGRRHKVGVNHLVGAITEQAGITSKQVGRIDILDEECLLEVEAGCLEQVLESMQGARICGRTVYAVPSERKPQGRPSRRGTSQKPQQDAHRAARSSRNAFQREYKERRRKRR